MEERRLFSPEDFREVLEKLFPYIPYFEERVNGTFKSSYYDTPETRKMDPEAYDRNCPKDSASTEETRTKRWNRNPH